MKEYINIISPFINIGGSFNFIRYPKSTNGWFVGSQYFGLGNSSDIHFTFWQNVGIDITDIFYLHATSLSDVIENKQMLNIPTTYKLCQNYPNLFNQSTIISYQMPVNSHVELSIYNINGQKVTTSVSQQQSVGYFQYKWNAIDLVGGVYLFRITTDDFVQLKKLILLK